MIKIIEIRLGRIDRDNRRRLTNATPTLICPSCIGGYIYHWLGIEFRSPFINLYMENNDFLTAMEHFDEFMAGPLVEETTLNTEWPVGRGVHGERIHFLHYPDFETALEEWNKRKERIDKSNMAVWLTNLGCGIEQATKYDRAAAEEVRRRTDAVVERFNRLPFKNKLIFSDRAIDKPNAIHIKHYHGYPQWSLFKLDKHSLLKRYIDQFDYVDYINNMEREQA